jgi:hypothetical protein
VVCLRRSFAVSLSRLVPSCLVWSRIHPAKEVAVQELEIGPLHRFQDWPDEQVPKQAAGVYTVWDGDRLLYVGMSGRAMTAEDLEGSDGGRIVAKGLRTRLNAHASGRRSGETSSASTSVTVLWYRPARPVACY